MFKHNKQKKIKRKESKQKKLKALLEICSLNDQDRKKSRRNSNFKSGSNGLPDLKEYNKSEEPNQKRIKREYLFPFNGVESSNEGPINKEINMLSEQQYADLKKLSLMRSKMKKERPCLELKDAGEAASMSLPDSMRVPLPFDDFQHFIIYSVLAHMATKGPARWIQIKKYQNLERRIFMIIEGAGTQEYLKNEEQLKTLSQFEKKLEVMTPLQYGGDLVEDLALVSLTNSQRDKIALEYGSLKEAFSSGDIIETFKTIFPFSKQSSKATKENFHNKELEGKKPNMTKNKFSRKLLLLTPWEMIEENYPLPVSGEIGRSCTDFVYTCDQYKEVTDSSPMWALDCEMCMTAYGSELTRICIIDENGDIVYETLVKPRNRIINYLTMYSGITAAMLKNVTTCLENVQADIRAICPPDLILIGQSLQMDLKAMKMIHPYVIDTSVIFNMSGIRHKKTKLRILVEEFLSLRIQVDDGLGHSPIEDALACMMLVQAKLQHSLNWGNAVLGGPRSREESLQAKMLLESREAAGMARMSIAKSKRLSWPQLTERRDIGGDLEPAPYRKSSHQVTETKAANTNICVGKSLFSHLLRHDKNAMLVAKKHDLDRWAPYCDSIKSQDFHIEEVYTNRAAIKYIRQHTPVNGTGVAYVSLNSQQPAEAIIKADKLVQKLMKNARGNTLYSIMLAGSPVNPGNGMLLLHLCRPHIPFICNVFPF